MRKAGANKPTSALVTGANARGTSLRSAAAPPIVDRVVRSPGQPLDQVKRAFMEPRFGHDFSKVRVHTDDRSVEAASSLDARSFTGTALQRKAGNSPESDGATLPDPDHEQAIRDKLSERGVYSKDVIEEMMGIEKEIAAAQQMKFDSKNLDEIVQGIEMRYFLVQTMKVVDKHTMAGSFQFPDQNRGYMIDQTHWTALSAPFDPPGSVSAFPGEQGYERNVFRPNYGTLIQSTEAQAVDAIFKANPRHPIVLDCNAMMVAVHYQAMKMAFGDEKFNKMFPEKKQGLYIGPVGDPEQQVYPDYNSSKTKGDKNHPFLELGLYTETSYPPGSFDEKKVGEELVTGDWVYFKNHGEYSDYSPGGMWRGEHSLYVGNGKFMGAGLVKMAGGENTFTYDDVLGELQSAYERVYTEKKDQKIPKAKLTQDKLPGIVTRLVPNMGALQKLPEVAKK